MYIHAYTHLPQYPNLSATIVQLEKLNKSRVTLEDKFVKIICKLSVKMTSFIRDLKLDFFKFKWLNKTIKIIYFT